MTRYISLNDQRNFSTSAKFGITIYSDLNINEISCSNTLFDQEYHKEVPKPILPHISSFPLNFSRCGSYVNYNDDGIRVDFCTNNHYNE